jgi:8-oxo-dGTP diphosphatase
MKEIAQVLLFGCDGRLLIYLRDHKSEIPFPNHWDFFGGHLEDGETPEEALVREVKEELNVDLPAWRFFRCYECREGDAYPNIKHVFYAQIDCVAADLVLYEGQRIAAIGPQERSGYRFANILGTILEDFVSCGLWPAAVDNRRRERDGK